MTSKKAAASNDPAEEIDVSVRAMIPQIQLMSQAWLFVHGKDESATGTLSTFIVEICGDDKTKINETIVKMTFSIVIRRFINKYTQQGMEMKEVRKKLTKLSKLATTAKMADKFKKEFGQDIFDITQPELCEPAPKKNGKKPKVDPMYQ